MAHLLARGWILAALLAQALALTVDIQPTTTALVSTPVATATHHHWTYSSRPLPSRRPCSARSSSAIPSSVATPAPSSAIPSSVATPATSLAIPSSSPVRVTPVISPSAPSSFPVRTSPAASSVIPSSRPVPSHSASSRPHWTYVSRPLPHRSCSSSASSSAFIPSSRPVQTTPAGPTPTVVTDTSILTSTGAAELGTTAASSSSGPQLTTSTVLTTRTATITACPTTIPNCPASAKTTFVTTETVVVSTTICPVTEAATITQAVPTSAGAGANGQQGNGSSELTTSTVFTTRTATITACPSSVTNCPARSKTTYLTTETIVAYTTICPVAEAATTAVQAVPTTSSSSADTGAHGQGNSGPKLTTSTVFTTRTATITACPSSVTDCPARFKTTYLTTETVVAYTTICPVADATSAHGANPTALATTGPAGVNAAGSSPELTTSTILTTRTTTITACPSSVTDCPARSKTAQPTTETLVIGTTVYPVANKPTEVRGGGAGAAGNAPSQTTSTVLSTRVATVSACVEDDSHCQTSQGAYLTTETLVVATTVVPVTSAVQTSVAAEGVDAVTAVPVPTYATLANGGVAAGADTTYTTTITVDSCSSNGTCTGYVSTITVSKTDAAQSTAVGAAAPHYTPGGQLGFATSSHAALPTSARLIPASSSQHGGGAMSAAVVPSGTGSAAGALYTGAAAAGAQGSVLGPIVGTVMAVLMALSV